VEGAAARATLLPPSSHSASHPPGHSRERGNLRCATQTEVPACAGMTSRLGSDCAPNRHAFIFATPSAAAALSPISQNLCPVSPAGLYSSPSPRICEVATNGLRGEVGGWGVDPLHLRPSEPGGCESAPGVGSSAPPLPAAWGKALRRHWPGRCARAGLKSRQPGNESARGSNPIAWRGSGLTFHAGLPRYGVLRHAGRSHRGPPSQNRATGRVRSPAEPLPPATSHRMLLTLLKSLATD
jgi:hypothetical protein